MVGFLLVGIAPGTGYAYQTAEVDLQLVLATDVSGSMDLDELRLQQLGYVSAFRDPGLLGVISSGPLGRIAVTYVEWAGPRNIGPSCLGPSSAIGIRLTHLLAALQLHR